MKLKPNISAKRAVNSRSRSGIEDDFTDVLPSFHDPMRFGDLRERQDGVDNRPHPSACKQRPYLGLERAGSRGLLVHAPRTQRAV